MLLYGSSVPYKDRKVDANKKETKQNKKQKNELLCLQKVPL